MIDKGGLGMVRISKEPEERRSEILDIAKELFRTKGYDLTTTNEIIERIGIARGTLYYYFKTKDDILNAVIDRMTEEGANQLKEIVYNGNLNAIDKLKLIVAHGSEVIDEDAKDFEYFHKKGNEVLHLRSLIQSVKTYTPLLEEILHQGVEEGLFHTEFTNEYSEFVLIISSFLFDDEIFPMSKELHDKKLRALGKMMEVTLRAQEGTFNFMK